MSLTKGDHLVIKRDGYILTPDVGEGNHEFFVLEYPQHGNLVFADGSPCPTAGNWYEEKVYGVDYFETITVKLKVIQ